VTLDPDPLYVVPDDPRVPERPVLRPSRPWGCVLAVALLVAYVVLR
jgi:hypothetical protein